MPEFGRYEKLPRPESIAKFVQFLQGNKVVRQTDILGRQVLRVDRKGLSSITLFMTNVYIVGEADVYEITSAVPQLNSIVTMSAWNSYTQQAKSLCLTMDIGLFKFREFLGAVYQEGDDFLNYISPAEREARKRLGE